MPAWSINNVIRTPLLLMAGVESLILFSSVYVAALILFGNLENFERYLASNPSDAQTDRYSLLSEMRAVAQQSQFGLDAEFEAFAKSEEARQKEKLISSIDRTREYFESVQ